MIRVSNQAEIRKYSDGSDGANIAASFAATLPTSNMGWDWDARYVTDTAGGGGNILTVDGSTAVSWKDMSGNNRHGDQATAGYRGTFETNEINTNMPCVQMDTDFYRNYRYTPGSAFSEPITMYFVVKPMLWSRYMNYLNLDGSSYAAYLEQEVATPQCRARFGVSGADLVNTSQLTLGAWHLVMIVLNGTSSIMRVDNNAAFAIKTGGYTYPWITLGYGTGGYCAKQKVARWLGYFAAHSDVAGDGATALSALNTLYAIW